MSLKIHVIGATGRTGRRLCAALSARGDEVIQVVRDPAGPAGARQAALEEPGRLAAALGDARIVVSCAYASHTSRILAAAPPAARLVLVGTARRVHEPQDPAGADALAAERLLLHSGRSFCLLHPTMIYGDAADGTVSRLAALLARHRVLPVPTGGVVQPLHVNDLVACLMAALQDGPQVAFVGGPLPVAYRGLLQAVARAAGLPVPVLVPVPGAIVRLSRRPGLERLARDRSVGMEGMHALGVRPRSLEHGLSQMFASGN